MRYLVTVDLKDEPGELVAGVYVYAENKAMAVEKVKAAMADAKYVAWKRPER